MKLESSDAALRLPLAGGLVIPVTICSAGNPATSLAHPMNAAILSVTTCSIDSQFFGTTFPSG